MLTIAALTTVDGVHARPRDWAGPYFGDQAAARALDVLEECEAMIMGRGTYDYFAPAWPKASGPYADRINTMPKIVFSATLSEPEWSNTRVIADDPIAVVDDLKQTAGDLIMYGYGRLGRLLLETGRVDVFKITVFPTVHGAGDPLFRPGRSVPLTLSCSEPFDNGSVELTYTR